MATARYRIRELDAADHVVDSYSLMCRSDTAALIVASKGTEADSVAAVEVWEGSRRVVRLDPVTPWDRLRRVVSDIIVLLVLADPLA